MGCEDFLRIHIKNRSSKGPPSPVFSCDDDWGFRLKITAHEGVSNVSLVMNPCESFKEVFKPREFSFRKRFLSDVKWKSSSQHIQQLLTTVPA